jgi:UDPglucose--hexose-1-phosphate uridylyltransferase
VLADETRDAMRVIAENSAFIAFAPSFARFPFETQIYARRHVVGLAQLTGEEICDLSSIVRIMRRKYDGLYGFPLPLMMAVQQAGHLYLEFLPLQRSPTKLKYLAAVESSLGTFLNDVPPEDAAERLRAVPA